MCNCVCTLYLTYIVRQENEGSFKNLHGNSGMRGDSIARNVSLLFLVFRIIVAYCENPFSKIKYVDAKN